MTLEQNKNLQKKIAFFGTPDFTADFLEVLAAHGYTPSLIVTNPDRPIGRGQVLTSPAPKVWAQKRAEKNEGAIRVLQPEVLDDAFLETLAHESWDLFIVIAYGKMLPEKVISIPLHGTINLHYSLLPLYRGATPVESAILNGDTETGITFQQMAYKLDSGDLILQEKISLTPTDTTPILRERLNTRAQELFLSVLEALFAGTSTKIPQDESHATRCTKIKKTDGLISLSDDPVMLDRKFRAYTPWPGIYFTTTHRGNPLTVKITAAHYIKNRADDHMGASGSFVIDEVIPENHKRMSYKAFEQFIAS